MPKTKFIFWERRGRLAAEARSHLQTAPAAILEVRDEREFLAALQRSPFPVVILERSVVGDKSADAIAAAAAKDAWIVVIGPGTPDESRRDLDLGARLLFHDIPDRRTWGATLRRLMASQSQATSIRPA